MSENSPRTLQTVERTCRVLEAVRRSGEVGVTNLAEDVDLTKGAVYNHLMTLEEQGYVIKQDQKYRLSYKFINFGNTVMNQSALYQVGRTHVDQLADETGEHAHLMIESEGQGYYIYRSQGENAIAEDFHERKSERSDFLHYSSTGKAVLAELSRERIGEIIEEYGLPKVTEKTITDRQTLFDELERTCKQGYAENDEEEIPGTRAVGAAIRDEQFQIRGAVSISGPKSRISGEVWEKTLPEQVQQAANLIEIDLKTKLRG